VNTDLIPDVSATQASADSVAVAKRVLLDLGSWPADGGLDTDNYNALGHMLATYWRQ